MPKLETVNTGAMYQTLLLLGGAQMVSLAQKLYKAIDEAETRGWLEGEKFGYAGGIEAGIYKANRNYEDGHNDGWTNGYVDGVQDARVNPKKADAVIAGMSTEHMDQDTLQLGLKLINAESPEDRNAAATDSDVPGN